MFFIVQLIWLLPWIVNFLVNYATFILYWLIRSLIYWRIVIEIMITINISVIWSKFSLLWFTKCVVASREDYAISEFIYQTFERYIRNRNIEHFMLKIIHFWKLLEVEIRWYRNVLQIENRWYRRIVVNPVSFRKRNNSKSHIPCFFLEVKCS